MNGELLFWLCAIVLLVLVAVVVFRPWWKAGKKDKAVCAGLVFTFLCGAVYLYLGNPFLINIVAAEQQLWAEKVVRIEALQTKAVKEGLSAEEWAELGQIQSSAENYRAAADAFKQAAIVSEGDAEYILQLGRNLMFAEEGTVTDEARDAFVVVEKLSNHPEATFYLAVYDVQQGNAASAKTRFEHLLATLPEGIPLRRTIEKQLELLETGKR